MFTYLPVCVGYDIAALARPAGHTGGDIYDVFALGRNWGDPPPLMIILADASGHGIGPALSVTQFRAMVRLGVRLDARLEQVLEEINQQLLNDLVYCRFITVFITVSILSIPVPSKTMGGEPPPPPPDPPHAASSTGISRYKTIFRL